MSPADPASAAPSPKPRGRRAFTLNVGGQKLKVEWAQIEAYGMYFHDEHRIVINESLQDDSALFVETLRHEIIHAAFSISGISFGWTTEQEEQVVRCLDGIFFPAWEKVLTNVRKQQSTAA